MQKNKLNLKWTLYCSFQLNLSYLNFAYNCFVWEKAKAIEIVTEMLKEGFEIEKIAKLTGLREYEIAELDKYEAAILKNEK